MTEFQRPEVNDKGDTETSMFTGRGVGESFLRGSIKLTRAKLKSRA